MFTLHVPDSKLMRATIFIHITQFHLQKDCYVTVCRSTTVNTCTYSQQSYPNTFICYHDLSERGLERFPYRLVCTMQWEQRKEIDHSARTLWVTFVHKKRKYRTRYNTAWIHLIPAPNQPKISPIWTNFIQFPNTLIFRILFSSILVWYFSFSSQ